MALLSFTPRSLIRRINFVFIANRIQKFELCTCGLLQLQLPSSNCLFTTPFATLRTDTVTLKLDRTVEASKEQIISKLNFNSFQDALPFYKLPFKTLLHIYKVTKNDERYGYCKNRLYYMSSILKHPPDVLSKLIAQRIFVYSLSFEWLKSSLDVLLEMGVSNDRIVRDLWVLKYKHETIRQRLERVRNMGIDNLYPWMVRCSEEILDRYIKLSQDTKDILGETKSTQIYLANRLNTSVEAVDDMCLRTPALKTIRVTKVKQFLDFLLNEGFKVEDIANKPRIFAASQKTVKQRINKLRSIGIQEINLNVLCRSKKHFTKFCESFEDTTEKNFIS